MARITGYDSSEQMTSKTPGVEMNPQVASAPGRMLSDVGQGIEGASEAILKVQKLSEQTSAQNAHDRALNAIEVDFAREDISQMTPEQISTMKSSYSEKIANARTQAADLIGLPGWKNEWAKEQERNSLVTQSKVDSMLLGKYVDKTKGDLRDFVAGHRNDFILATNFNEKVNEINQLRTKIDEAEKAHFLKAGEGELLFNNTMKDWNQAHLAYDAHERPQFALQEIEKGKDGLYDGMPAEKVAEAKAKAESRIKEGIQKSNFIRKDKHEELTRSLLKDALNGKDITLQVEEGINNGTLDMTNKKDMDAIKKQMTFHADKLGPSHGWHGSDATAYNKLLDTLTDRGIPVEEKVRAMYEAAAPGSNIAKADVEKLYNMHIVPTEDGNESMKEMNSAQKPTNLDEFYEQKKKQATERSDSIRKQQDNLSAAHEMIRSNVGNPESSATMTRDLYARLNSGKMKPEEAPTVAHKMIYDAALKALKIDHVPKEGILVMDAAKHKRRILPDGAWRDE